MTSNYLDNADITLKSPDIFQYTLATQFLNDYYNYRKQRNSDLSYEMLSFELGINNRSYMYSLCTHKKTVPLEIALLISQKLAFNEKQTEHFVLICLHQRSRNLAEKKILQEKYLETLFIKKQTAIVNDVDLFLSDLTLPLLHLILSFKDVAADLNTLVEMTSIDKETLKEKLQILKNLNLVSIENDLWKSVSEGFKVSTLGLSETKIRFYTENLKQAALHLQGANMLSKYKHMSLSMTEEVFTEFVKEVDSLFNKLKNKFGQNTLNNSRVFKVNLQAYPVTEKYIKSLVD